MKIINTLFFLGIIFTLIACDDNSTNGSNLPDFGTKNQRSKTKPDCFWPIDSGNIWIYETKVYENKKWSEPVYDTIRVWGEEPMNWYAWDKYKTYDMFFSLNPWISRIDDFLANNSYITLFGTDSILSGRRYGPWEERTILPVMLYTFRSYSSRRTINTPIGKFRNCYNFASDPEVYFSPGVGIVKIFAGEEPTITRRPRVESTLVGYTVK